ncbi:MAG TPA: hypoxanthine phosphoribosyltransferase [Phototrophicaceae bacterium]|jgi:hypoxanthine phosphoribosyltransferase|nr:hypoxanthine phosphoribosyltransferase [Phototrophicaceae bacterium]
MQEAYEKHLQEILIDEQTLQRRIAELGAQLTAEYANCERLLLVCILKGGVMFLCDLSRHIRVPHEIDFMAVSSYGKGARASSRSVRIDMDLTADLRGKHVLIIEDIIDSGYTLESVMKLLRTRHPASLKLCTLLNKASRREIEIPIDYIGFDIEDKFVFGYGLDLDEKFRNLPFIGVVDTSTL